jgi:hypothetical protein
MSEPTTSYGYELSIGSDTDINDVPVCCDDMEGKDTESGGREYTCPDCSTVVSISSSGLVDDIYETAA